MGRRILQGVSLLIVLAVAPQVGSAQDAGGETPPRTDPGFELQQNYPNPFNPTTRIPFTLKPGLFEDGRPVAVTMRIFNVLLQPVAIPTALNHPSGNGVRVDRLEFTTPGQYEAFWDGFDTDGRQVASGMYYLQVIVKGERQIMKMIVAK